MFDLQGVSKKRNTFDLEYPKDGSTYLIVLLECYSVLPYSSIEPNQTSFITEEWRILSKWFDYEKELPLNFDA